MINNTSDVMSTTSLDSKISFTKDQPIMTLLKKYFVEDLQTHKRKLALDQGEDVD